MDSRSKMTVQCEIGLIGAILLDSRCLTEVVDVVAPDEFASHVYGEIYSTILDMYAAGESIDHITVGTAMRAKGGTDDEYHKIVYDALSLQATIVNAHVYAKQIHNDAKMRRIKSLLTSVVFEAYDNPDELIDSVMEELSNIERGSKRGVAVPLKTALDEFIVWALDKSPDRRVDTGYKQLDEVLRGMLPGNLVILAARPGVGKSAMAAEIALKNAGKGIASVIFSCEMSRLELAQRYVANKSGISLNAVTDRSFLSDARGGIIANELEPMKAYPLHLYDEPGISLTDIRRTLQTHKDIGLAVVDYIQLMNTTERGENRNLEISAITRGLKLLAKEFKIPIMGLSQLNRTRDEYSEPGLTALRDSGSIEQDADKAVFLWKLEAPMPGCLPKIGVKVAKNRMAPTGTVVMYYKGENVAFLEADEDYVPKKQGRGRQFTAVNNRDPDFPWEELE